MRREIYDSAMRDRFAALDRDFPHCRRRPRCRLEPPAQQLARKIAAFTGPGTVAFSVQNRSSLAGKEVETITADLRSQLETLGVHPADPESAAGSVTVFLSENPQSYVWVAEMQVGSHNGVAMVQAERGDGNALLHDSTGLTLRKIPLWTQEERILDVAVLEEDSAPKYIAVLDAEKVALYRRENTKVAAGACARHPAWAAVAPGCAGAAGAQQRIICWMCILPGVVCRSTTTLPLSLNCRESDDPWPLVVTSRRVFRRMPEGRVERLPRLDSQAPCPN